MPTRADVDRSIAVVEAARKRLEGGIVIDLVVSGLLRGLPEGLRGRVGAAHS